MNTDVKLLEEAYVSVTEARINPIRAMIDELEHIAGNIRVYKSNTDSGAVGVETPYAIFHLQPGEFIQVILPFHAGIKPYYTACEQELNKALAMHIKFEYEEQIVKFKIPFSRQTLIAAQDPLQQLYVKALNPQD
jgi:hypothetical protein